MKGLVIEFGKKPKASDDESGAEGESADDEYGKAAKTKAAEAIMAAARSGDAAALVDALDTYLAACE